MAREKTISGAQALSQMRALRHSRQTFEMYHLTWNEKKQETNGMRKVDKCRLRKGLTKESLSNDPDLYLLYTDVEKKEPRMCYKKLVRYVAFPPSYELLKINWF